MKKRIFFVIFLVTLFGIISVTFFYIYPPIKVILEGEPNIFINLNDEYVEPGYKGMFISEDLTSSVVVSGNVDTSIIGQYKITYTLKKGKRIVKKERIINVTDNIKPEISLKGPRTIYLYKGKKYKEYGYSVSDNYDKDIKVDIENNIDINTLGKYEVKYKVFDSSNNEAEVIRNVEVVNHPLIEDVPVLMYHFFYNASLGQTGPDANYTEVRDFDAQIKYLVENNYYFPSWEEVNDYLDGIIALPKKSIVLTFDDGASSFYNIGYPVLAKYKVTGTVFAITSWGVPKQENFPYVSFQSHSHDMHRGGCQEGHGGLLQCINHDDAIKDLKLSMEKTYGATVFCYPFGDYNDRAVNLLKEANFSMAFTTEWGRIRPGMNKYKLPRVRVSGGISLNYFKDLAG